MSCPKYTDLGLTQSWILDNDRKSLAGRHDDRETDGRASGKQVGTQTMCTNIQGDAVTVAA